MESPIARNGPLGWPSALASTRSTNDRGQISAAMARPEHRGVALHQLHWRGCGHEPLHWTLSTVSSSKRRSCVRTRSAASSSTLTRLPPDPNCRWAGTLRAAHATSRPASSYCGRWSLRCWTTFPSQPTWSGPLPWTTLHELGACRTSGGANTAKSVAGPRPSPNGHYWTRTSDPLLVRQSR